MFRVVFPPIIRSTYNCIYSIWHWSDRNCYLLLSWRSWGAILATHLYLLSKLRMGGAKPPSFHTYLQRLR